LPFSPAKGTTPVGLRVTSDTVPKLLPKPAASQLYVQDGDVRTLVSDGYLTAAFSYSLREESKAGKGSPNAAKDQPSTTGEPGPQVLNGKTFSIEASVPSDVQKATGTVRLQSPDRERNPHPLYF
jgi:hypothetical protein